ncbi:MAG: beta-N-acetylhexosaminidase [bacterium]
MMNSDLERKVAQLLIVGVSGPQLSSEEKKSLNKLAPGGVILFKRNYQNINQVVSLCNDIQAAIIPHSYKGWATWMGVDHEGGRVQRFGEPFTKIPPAKTCGDLNSPKTTFELGFIMAKELHSVGVRLNFAPVADVPRDMNAPALGDRAYSLDPEIVSSLVSATVRGLQKGGVMAVAKHFPGHGPANVDSHSELPKCHLTKDQLEACDWMPFRRAIRARCNGIMTAHILNTALDSERPATLSKKIIRNYLRNELRFKGLVFSDDMEMGAIVNDYGIDDACLMAVEAGCDHVLICQNFDAAMSAHERLVKAFEGGLLPLSYLDEALERISNFKNEYIGQYKDSTPDFAEAVLGKPDFQAVAEAIREKRIVENGPSTIALKVNE